jgi:glycine/D-amino acid oxidase-like deaminating enzyme
VRIVIVGGGVIGLVTAITAVQGGHLVEVYDQAEIPSPRATSFDWHRALRGLHPDQPAVTALSRPMYHQWMQLQSLLSIRCYEQVGALTVLPPHRLAHAQADLAVAGWPATAMSADQLAATYPHLSFSIDAGGILEPRAGVLLADRILAGGASWLRQHRQAHLHPGRTAVGVDADRIAVRFADGELVRADAILLSTGPWAKRLLPPRAGAPLVLRRQSVLYGVVPLADLPTWLLTPATLSLGADRGSWLVPPVAATPLKVSAASAARIVSEVTDTTTPARWRSLLIDRAREVIDGFTTDWLVDTRDSYYLSRARVGGPLLVELGRQVWAYAACGGGSFKFAPLIAASLLQRLTGQAVPMTARYPPSTSVVDLGRRGPTGPHARSGRASSVASVERASRRHRGSR